MRGKAEQDNLHTGKWGDWTLGLKTQLCPCQWAALQTSAEVSVKYILVMLNVDPPVVSVQKVHVRILS